MAFITLKIIIFNVINAVLKLYYFGILKNNNFHVLKKRYVKLKIKKNNRYF